MLMTNQLAVSLFWTSVALGNFYCQQLVWKVHDENVQVPTMAVGEVMVPFPRVKNVIRMAGSGEPSQLQGPEI